MSYEKMREEFEAAVLREWPYPNLNRCDVPGSNRLNEYVDSCVEYAWWGWKNSRAALVIDLPTSCSKKNTEVIKAVGRHIFGQGIQVRV